MFESADAALHKAERARDDAAKRLAKTSKPKAQAKAAADAAAAADALERAAARSVQLAARAAAEDDDASRRVLAELARADAAVARAERDGERWRAAVFQVRHRRAPTHAQRGAVVGRRGES